MELPIDSAAAAPRRSRRDNPVATIQPSNADSSTAGRPAVTRADRNWLRSRWRLSAGTLIVSTIWGPTRSETHMADPS